MLSLYDAHNHLHDAWLLPHRDRILADLAASGVRACVVNGSNETDWPQVSAFCSSARPPRPEDHGSGSLRLLPSFGLHPWDVGNRTGDWRTDLLRRVDDHPHVFIGEIGLDRWMLERARADDPRLAGLRRAPLDEQIEAFRWQLTIAAERNRTVSIHCLDAFGALHDVLRSTPLPSRGFLLHAYNGSSELARAFAELGGYFSFNGAFLDPRKKRIRDLYTQLPLDRLLVETDSPAMQVPPGYEQFSLPRTPDGQPINHPANLVVSYSELAKIRDISVEQLSVEIEHNFEKLFGPANRAKAS